VFPANDLGALFVHLASIQNSEASGAMRSGGSRWWNSSESCCGLQPVTMVAFPEPLRIAMWSGPRNISTAMMRSWGNRPDTIVIDEPFYAFYLHATGKDHPGAEEVIATRPTDWRKVISSLTNKASAGKTILYQKQMTLHLLPEVDRTWLGTVTSCFLIRDPAEVINSYLKKNDAPTLEDVGFVQQGEIFDWVSQHTEKTPPVIDARDVLLNPERILRLLCDAVGVEFDRAMLSWPSGLRASDGIWAKHWYGEVAQSTSFQPYRPKNERVPEHFREIHKQCRECYERLHEVRLR
jgi:Sulfotransferase domain